MKSTTRDIWQVPYSGYPERSTVAGTRIPLPVTVAGGTVARMGMGATFRMPRVVQKFLAKHLALLALLAANPYFMLDSGLLTSHLSSHFDPTLKQPSLMSMSPCSGKPVPAFTHQLTVYRLWLQIGPQNPAQPHGK